ncbi:MAG: phenylalanine--tRNA ligase subunit beta [Candidatus Brockarchaeota archaeon]|nr:phenylalanine--tRNA ligase subunit beta [Candidatus Brockarchaeota archaeon]MBO3762724.1 phenylalanine--tRNA ligase subunit beta [Candidatus Brockarchaeota archaeon]MBO3768442.1 phenylalanine--tRNA ligase subunit beta [Candidatus Brockarchaeota archaeon]MBO3801544.1 phenylalanine--tRNA ligase subunit beta [Candidatus Brockarchaeota archaeon]
MPTIKINYEDLVGLIGKSFEPNKIKEVLPNAKCNVESIEGNIWILEVTSDRPDHFSSEGIARTLKGLLGVEEGLRKFESKISKVEVIVDESVKSIRPFIMSAVIDDLKLNDESIVQMMQLQDKLHDGIGQRRKLVSIGTYDLDKLGRRIFYKVMKLKDIVFVPLGYKTEMNGKEILDLTEQGKKFRNIIPNDVAPILEDERGNILSMPPIINGEQSKVTENTKNIFIDVTGLSKVRVEDALIVLSTSLCERGGSIEWVKVIEKNTGNVTLPNDKNKDLKITSKDIKENLGLELENNKIIKLLKSVRFEANLVDDEILVKVPIYRRDVFSNVDIIEDVAIAFGYNNLTPESFLMKTIGKPSEKKMLERKAKLVMIGMEFQEVVTPFLCSIERANNWNYNSESKVIELENPSIEGYESVRPSLIPGLLNSIRYSAHASLPHRVFEVGRVAIVMNSKIHEFTNIAAAISDDKVDLGEGHMRLFWFIKSMTGNEPKLEAFSFDKFIEGRSARIKVKDSLVGIIGEVNPENLLREGIRNPTVVWELNLEELLGSASTFFK